MSAPRLCRRCGVAPAVGEHSQSRGALAKAQYCAACRAVLRRRPASRVTPDQAAQLRALVGVIPQGEICARLGLSKANITRWIWESGHPSKHYNAYPPDVVQAVCAAFGALGKVRTQALFPDVNVRAVVDRHPALHAPRLIRWTGEQVVEAVRMAGLVSATAQARFFGRPNAYAGSIKSLWAKHLGCSPHDLHGLAASVAWPIARAGVPGVLVAPDSAVPGVRVKVLWISLAAWLRTDVDATICRAVQTLAHWQGWAWETTDVDTIRATIAQREDPTMSLTVGSKPGQGQGNNGFANGTSVLPARPPVDAPEDTFNARGIVATLAGLMESVTAEAVTPETVQAACLCAAQISNLIRVHLEAERLRRLTPR